MYETGDIHFATIRWTNRDGSVGSKERRCIYICPVDGDQHILVPGYSADEKQGESPFFVHPAGYPEERGRCGKFKKFHHETKFFRIAIRYVDRRDIERDCVGRLSDTTFDNRVWDHVDAWITEQRKARWL